LVGDLEEIIGALDTERQRVGIALAVNDQDRRGGRVQELISVEFGDLAYNIL